MGGDADAERSGRPLAGQGERLAGTAVTGAQVEEAEPAGPADGGGKACVGFAERADADDGVRHGRWLL